MSYLIFARLRDVNCPWFVTTLHTFPEPTAKKIVIALNGPNWEYSYGAVDSKNLIEPYGEVQ